MKMNNISDDVHKVTKTNTQTIHYIQNHWSDILMEGCQNASTGIISTRHPFIGTIHSMINVAQTLRQKWSIQNQLANPSALPKHKKD